MKIQNADSRDNDFYEIHLIPKNQKEENSIYKSLKNVDSFELNFEDWGLDVDVISVSDIKRSYDFKSDFIDEVKRILRRK